MNTPRRRPEYSSLLLGVYGYAGNQTKAQTGVTVTQYGLVRLTRRPSYAVAVDHCVPLKELSYYHREGSSG